MKIKNYIALLSVAALFTACDIDTYPEGGAVTQEQKEEVNKYDPSKLKSDMNALKAVLSEFGGSDSHTNFGTPAMCLFQDCSGMDMVSENHGYNWLAPQLLFRDRLSTSYTSNYTWKYFYGHIKTANDVLKTLYAGNDESQRVGEVANYIGQALASRAFDYLELIQVFQFTYLGHEDALGLPMALEDLTYEMSQNNPRVPVKDVYAQIMKDLDQAIKYLEEYPITRADKTQITAEVAYGLRARANMLMGKYAEAAADADKALKGARPYSISEVSVPTFVDAKAESWIWGIVITEENDVVKTGIINWPSHLCSFTGNGYTTAIGMPVVLKRINSQVYAHMDKSDVRRGWWINPESHDSPLLQNAWGLNSKDFAGALGFAYPDYTNMKFGPEANEPLNPTNAQDWPLMRAEEMLLIKAEALARTQGVGAGKAVLEGFIKQFRAPEYVCKAGSLKEFIDEVWMQRRIELWGEGFSLKDVLRLKKPIVRKGANFSRNVTFDDIAPESAIMIYNIPEAETNTNKGITLDQINEVAVPPTPLI